MLISISRMRQNWSRTFLKISIFTIFHEFQHFLKFSIISRLRPQPNPYHHLDLALKFPVWASIPENLGSRPQSCQILRPMECIWSGTDGIWKHLEASGGICMVSAHKSSATLERNAKVSFKCWFYYGFWRWHQRWWKIYSNFCSPPARTVWWTRQGPFIKTVRTPSV